MISVVIPVYNSEKYLEKCLDSILKQTYKDLEIICVDDGSADKSFNILKKYASKDNRLKCYKNDLKGVSAARNYALARCSGDYVLFVDSDDWIDETTCEVALKTIEAEEADSVIWPYIRERTGESRKKHIFDRDTVFDEEKVQKQIHRRMIGILDEELAQPENADALCTVWGKLYKRKIIVDKNITFYDLQKIGTYEDGLFNLEYFRYVKKAVFLNHYLYHYRKTNTESITVAYNEKLSQQWASLFHIMQAYIEQNNLSKEYKEALNNRISLSLIPLGFNEITHKCSVREKIVNIKKILSQREYEFAVNKLKIQYMPFYWKIFFKAARQRRAIAVFILLNVMQKFRGK